MVQPRHRFRSHLQRTGFLTLRLRHVIAGSPLHPAETGSSSCRLLVRLRLLSTPPRGDAVAFGYMCRDLTWAGLSPSCQSNITVARLRAAPQPTLRPPLARGISLNLLFT